MTFLFKILTCNNEKAKEHRGRLPLKALLTLSSYYMQLLFMKTPLTKQVLTRGPETSSEGDPWIKKKERDNVVIL